MEVTRDLYTLILDILTLRYFKIEDYFSKKEPFSVGPSSFGKAISNKSNLIKRYPLLENIVPYYTLQGGIVFYYRDDYTTRAATAGEIRKLYEQMNISDPNEAYWYFLGMAMNTLGTMDASGQVKPHILPQKQDKELPAKASATYVTYGDYYGYNNDWRVNKK